MQASVFVLALATCSVATGQVQLSFATTPANYVRVLGGKFFIGSEQVNSLAHTLSTQTTVRSQLVVFPNNVVLGGSGNDIPTDAKLDPSGNIWIVGNTDSDDFALVNPVISRKVPYRVAGFLLELDPTGTKVLFSTYIAGQQPSSLTYYSRATALAIDLGGNVYVGGDTDEPDFPTTPGVIKSTGPGADGFGAAFSYSFLAKVSSTGKLVYSTLITTGTPDCVGGSGCIGRNSTYANIPSLAVDGSGAVTVAGSVGGATAGIGYITRISQDASKLLWTTTIGDSYGSVDTLFMALDATGSVDLLGRYAPVITTLGFPQAVTPPGLFAARLSADGSQVLYSTDLGQSSDAVAIGITLDSSGNPYLVGNSSSPKFPVLAGVPDLGSNFVLRLDPAGINPQTLFRFPSGVAIAPVGFDAASNLLALGVNGALLTLSPSYDFKTPAVIGFANAASFAMNTGLFQAALVSFFGYNLADVSQIVMSGTASILYAGPNQINVETPPGYCSCDPPITLFFPSGTFSFTPLPIQSVGIFTVDGTHAAALNQDGSANSAANPAAAGSIISLFGTGESNFFGTVSVDSQPLNVLYFGPAPGLPGVFQINVRLAVAGPLILQTAARVSGELTSNPVLVYTK